MRKQAEMFLMAMILPPPEFDKKETEQRVIRLIRNLNKDGYSLRRICRELEQAGYLTKRGNLIWHPQTVATILKRQD